MYKHFFIIFLAWNIIQYHIKQFLERNIINQIFFADSITIFFSHDV